MDALDQAEKGMGFGGDEPTSFLRLKEDDDAEIVIYQSVEVVPATQKEIDDKFANEDGKTLEYRFSSPFSGKTRTHRSNGQGLLIGLKNAMTGEADPTDGKPVTRKVQEGETVSIKRTGAGGDTRYNVTILTPEQVEQAKQERGEAEANQEAQEQGKQEAVQAGEPEPDMSKPASDEEIKIEDIPF